MSILKDHRNALFKLNSQIPYVHTSSESIVRLPRKAHRVIAQLLCCCGGARGCALFEFLPFALCFGLCVSMEVLLVSFGSRNVQTLFDLMSYLGKANAEMRCCSNYVIQLCNLCLALCRSGMVFPLHVV
ncbi:hypothetical protein HPP92_008198 [Vanilla planifolia]|uniref:Uncharacterized protein n=1 Tax=Vanilla planifolia TaxID=51239 RepID=A0A835R984_VANPL|nr:hypothetical protein HPP92_008198 [Vanilla planifolia]